MITNYEEQSEIMDQIKNEENIILVCFYPNNEFNNNTEDFKIQLQQITSSVIFHTEFESFITFIKSIQHDKIFLIISNSCISQILSHLITLHQIDSIFIFNPKKTEHQHLPLENLKIIGIYDQLDLLYISIKEQINLTTKQAHQWCFFDQIDYTTKDLSKLSSDFLWLQIFHTVLLHLPCNQQFKRQKIDNFDHDYQPNEAIQWFMKHSVLQRTINKALQNEDIHQLYLRRYFLSDLVEQLKCEHQTIINCKREYLTVYREMKLSNDEFNHLIQNKGKLISMKGFFDSKHLSIICINLKTD